MYGGRSSTLHYGSLIETNNLYAPTPNGQKSEYVVNNLYAPTTNGEKSKCVVK